MTQWDGNPTDRKGSDSGEEVAVLTLFTVDRSFAPHSQDYL